MALNLTDTLSTIKNRQWMLGDIDWDAPGADLVTDEQKPDLKKFMADLVGVEHAGARAFAALSRSAPTEELREIYRYFQAEEQKHANAELALMRRWGLLETDEVPLPNIEIWHALAFVEEFADHASFDFMATFIPMLETALDGALLKFLTEKVEDPLLVEVLTKINNDESRHLAVGYHVMTTLGAAGVRRSALQVVRTLTALRVLKPRHVIGWLPVFSNMRDSLYAMGMDGSRLGAAFERFQKVGERNPETLNNLMYRGATYYAKWTIEENRLLEAVNARATRIARRWPMESWPTRPSWTDELTYEVSA